MSNKIIFLIITVLGVGKIPIAPGTFGSLAAIIVGSLVVNYSNYYVLTFLIMFSFVTGTYAIYVHDKSGGIKDSSEIVIDEFYAQLLPFFFISPNVFDILFIFLTFRICDIFKPWPCNIIDKKIKNHWGVMFDDLAASIQTIIIYIIANYYLL